MNSKMTTNSQLSTTKPKKAKTKQTKQTSRTETKKWRSGDHMEVYQWEGERGRMGKRSRE